ncbi:YolD-like family protein [Paenibacillaceae bacterium]|nr:YolD-like family protein [Paenibacillaceae bacterium]
MRKKLEGNGMWETSRMMIPEHVRAANLYRKEQRKRQRIQLDDQELELFGLAIAESKEQRKEIAIKIFDEWEQLRVVGVVDRIDYYKRRFMVDGEWFFLVDVENVDISN